MKKILVPIFTEEYKIWVYIGSRAELVKAAAKYIGETEAKFDKEFVGRGQALDYIDKGLYPLIIVDGRLPVRTALATLAHEASHSMDSLERYIGIKDKHGEFRAHGIAAVVRTVSKHLQK
ncbi:hypothetical protein Nham_0310 [Nitrobacter hamburgensis X14]|uniref:Uncharacterized protein n=1 Tax=Nitrobacter hamburgensis (strain DSM 10229 / NCIMB 13809 / X14) TaxID=323097 RepID=Q1QRE1_NITHX|nr:hypothetical protein [Nitrobacter hamburgensis]ABE61206.1 hypothetical protein Nham_0310 [Nitrobacter hamburgensis X14]